MSRLRFVHLLAPLAMAALAGAAPAASMEMTLGGSTLRMNGPIRAGDDIKLRELARDIPAGQAITVDLASPGGFIREAREMGRIIRNRGWTTLVDAGRSGCGSACTIVFAAGVKRIYMNAGSLVEGVVAPQGFRGLGYHEANGALSLQPGRYSGVGVQSVINAYYEFGASAAADLVTKAPPSKLYRISGATAQRLGLATALGR